MKSITSEHFSKHAEDFIASTDIDGVLAKAKPDPVRIDEIIAKSLGKTALSVEETAVLLNADDKDSIAKIMDAAYKLKNAVYGNRIVLFAPLYIGNKCINDCKYCGFRSSNKESIRRTLTSDEIRKEVKQLEDVGHKRLILVYGEHPDYDANYIAETARTAYAVKSGHGEIRRLNINAAPLDIDGYKIVKSAGIGTYQIFQETYHHQTYAKYHPSHTRKGNYLWRLDGLSRAFEGGCDDVGIGVLFGLYDWKFETAALVRHALFLQERYNVGPHTISFPRFKPASGASISGEHSVSDEAFLRLIAILRLAVPYTGLICTARENPVVRREALRLGVSQIDAGTKLEIGGYSDAHKKQCLEREQFAVSDDRSLANTIHELIQDGYLPSFCTSCYRLGRTGEHFMEFSIPGFIKQYCTPNALLTLEEYLIDYASEETRLQGDKLINKEMAQLPGGEQKTLLEERLRKIRAGQGRDYCF